MSSIIPFTEAALPANITGRKKLLSVNKDIVTAAQFPSLSIKGKVFTLVQDSERKVLTKPDDPEETVQAVNMAFLRINMNAKDFYQKRFTEDDSEGVRPDCFSLDGMAPSPQSPNKQSERCSVCKHNVWGTAVSEDGKAGAGKRCSDKARIAIADPRHLSKPMLLRVPPASLKPLKDALKMVKTRSIEYNEVVFRVGFDREAASPKLTFKPVGVLDDAGYAAAVEMFESDIVRAIVGVDEAADHAPTQAHDEADASELDAALASRAKPAVTADELDAVVAPTPAPAAAPSKSVQKRGAAQTKPTPATPAPAVVPKGDDDLLGDLDGILGATDD